MFTVRFKEEYGAKYWTTDGCTEPDQEQQPAQTLAPESRHEIPPSILPQPRVIDQQHELRRSLRINGSGVGQQS
jgi:hypothetical protein